MTLSRPGSISSHVSLWLLTGFLLCFGSVHGLMGQSEVGIPFVKNFTPPEYAAHTQNFDITEDQEGNIYVANFAGLLKFDGQDWQLLTTPEISRVLKLVVSTDGTVYLGGLNEFGFLTVKANGTLQYQGLTGLINAESVSNFGEIKGLFTRDKVAYFFARQHLFIYEEGTLSTILLEARIESVFQVAHGFLWQSNDGQLYRFDTNSRSSKPIQEPATQVQLVGVTEVGQRLMVATAGNGLWQYDDGQWSSFPTAFDQALKTERVTSLELLSDGTWAIGTELNGLFVVGQKGEAITRLNRELGLQNDQVTATFTDSRNRLWLALNNGISLLSYPWPWTRYDINSGLRAGVVTMQRYQGRLFAGTYQGLYVLDESTKRFELFGGLDFATWSLIQREGKLYAATSEGIYLVEGERVTQLTTEFALSLAFTQQKENRLYAGTLSGFIELDLDDAGVNTLADDLEQITALTTDASGHIWLTSITGAIYRYHPETTQLMEMGAEQNLGNATGNRAFFIDGQLMVSTSNGLRVFDQASGNFKEFGFLSEGADEIVWPSLMHEGENEDLWLTQGDETGVTRYTREQNQWTPDPRFAAPFQSFVCRAILTEADGVTWLGGPDGIIRLDGNLIKSLPTDSELKLNQVVIGADSLYYGGHTTEQIDFQRAPDWSFAYRNLSFGLTTNGQEAQGQILFSHRLLGYEENWSEWTSANRFEYNNLAPGEYELQARSRNAYGQESQLAPFAFSISNPWYTKWYAFVAYALLFALMVREIVRWRSRKLLQEKEILESTVAERTAEISSQRDEIQKQSEELSTALNHLEETQEELIRQEKLASVGQLTKGIVDRVINPLNYINNFSQLSIELNEEIRELLEDEKEKIPEESYEELEEINGMMSDNLKMINTHGGSTTRMIKAMEEILKDRGGQRDAVDLNQLVVQSTNLVNHAYKSALTEHGIQLVQDFRDGEVQINASREEIAKCIHQLMDNAVQAVIARSEKGKLENAAVKVTTSAKDHSVYVDISDTGTGIPEKEIGQIFDPFFTTKTTAKGAGVGLYLVREIILSHKGKIEVDSIPNQGTAFKITLPMAQKNI